MRGDVARYRAVAIRVEQPFRRREIDACCPLSAATSFPRWGDDPYCRSRTSLQTGVQTGRRDRRAVGAGPLRRVEMCGAEHQQTGHPERIATRVTSQASDCPHELRRTIRRAGTLFERVKHHAGGFIVSRDFEELPITYPAERDPIAEVERTGILFVDELALQAVSRKDQQLRVDRNLEGVERRLQESAPALVCELDASPCSFLFTSTTGLFNGAVEYLIAGFSKSP